MPGAFVRPAPGPCISPFPPPPNKARQNSFNRILVDETRTLIKSDFHDSVITSQPLDDEFQRLGMRVAIICASHSLKMYKYFETALRDRAFDIMMVDNMEAGRTWLPDGRDP